MSQSQSVDSYAESRSSEEELRESQQRFAAFMDHLPGAAWMKDLQGRYVYANPEAERIFSRSLAELMGKTDTELFPAETARNFVENDRRALIEGSVRTTEALRQADGIEHHSIVNKFAVPGPDGERKYIGGVAFDITDRQRVEEALRESEQRFRVMADGTPLMIWVVDAKGRIEFINRACCEFVGTTQKGFQCTGWQPLLHPDDAASYTDAFFACLRDRTPLQAEARVRRHDGQWRWIETYAQPRFAASGEFLGMAGSNPDITERKRAEQAVASALAKAEQASQAKDHFLAVLSHELRNPLAPVTTATAMLNKRLEADPTARVLVEIIARNVSLEARLIDDLLDMTRIARGKVELDLRPAALCQVLRHTAEVCKSDIDARRLHFEVKIDDPPHYVHADPARLQQVFWNLLNNAVKFTPHGGCVGVHCWRENDQVIVEVGDSGEGIESEALERVFDAFEQAERAVTRRFGGLGLGLTISKALVEMHGGSIQARSEGKGKGATFTVRLPRIALGADAQPAVPAEQPTAGAAVRPLRILLVEDHGDTAQMMQQLLLMDGHRVDHAGDVALALEMAEQHAYDLLISDLGLPDATGFELMRQLRARGQTLPGIALSGYGSEQDKQRCQEAGFAAHLTKPIGPERLFEAIAAVAH